MGDRVTTTTLFTTVDKPGSLEAYIYVPVERASQLKMNFRCKFWTVRAMWWRQPDQFHLAGSRQHDSVGVGESYSWQPSGALRTLQFIRARVVWGTHPEPIVPVLAVSRVGGQYFAFVAEEQKGMLVAHQKPLHLGT